MNLSQNLVMKLLLILILSVSSFPLHAENNGDKHVYTVGIVPQQTPSKLARTWVPLLKLITKQTGLRFKFRTAKDIPAFEERLKNGVYDIVYMNPAHYTYFHEKSGYQAFAKAKNKKIKGIIVVHKDSDISSIEQLANHKIAFPSAGAFAATILPRSELDKLNIPYTPEYVYSHDSVYSNIVLGRYEAGGGVIRTLNTTEQKTKDMLKVLVTTKGYTPHAFAAKKTLAQDVVMKFQSQLLSLESSDEGLKILNKLHLQGIEAANDSDWDDVRMLKINY